MNINIRGEGPRIIIVYTMICIFDAGKICLLKSPQLKKIVFSGVAENRSTTADYNSRHDMTTTCYLGPATPPRPISYIHH